MEEPPGLKRKIFKDCFGGILRVGVVICCISATVYYGGLCIEKYVSNPATITSEMVPISELPPLQMSICRQVYLSDCTSPEFNIFNFFDYDDDNECVYEENTFGLYANSSEAYWTEIDGRLSLKYKLSDLVEYIDTWNETSSTWNRIFEYSMKKNSQFFRSQMVLQDEETGFLCHTLLMDVPNKIRLQDKGFTKLTYVVTHFEGDIHSALKNMMKLERIQYVSYVRVNVTALQLSPDYDDKCSDQIHECSDFNEKYTTNCSLPFDIRNVRPICANYNEGLEAIRSKLDHMQNCLKSCLQLQINYNEKPNKFMVSLVRPKYTQAFIRSSEDEIAIVFQMPKYAKLISYTHKYSLPVAMGYFGSIAGIFMGISVICILSWPIDYTNFSTVIKKWTLLISQLGMTVYLLIVLICLGNKFMEYPRDTSVNFAKTTSDFSMTICSSVQIYGLIYLEKTEFVEDSFALYKGVYVSYDMFLMTNESFWLKWTNPKNVIETLKVKAGSDEVDLIKENLPMKFSLLPIDNQTVDVCFTFELTTFSELSSLTIIYHEEIQVYIHNTRQFLYEWKNKQNLILPATKENVDNYPNSLVIYETSVMLNMERKIQLGTEDYQSYDECVIEYVSQELEAIPTKCFFGKRFKNCTEIITTSTLTLIRNLLQSENKCMQPLSILLTSADKSLSLDSVNIKSELIDSVKYDDTGSLGIKDNLQVEKPKIVFYFPEFTKLSQEYFSYTVGSFLGEFGGLVGILLGLSFLDLQFFFSKLKRKDVFNAILYLLCIGSVVYLFYEKIQIFVQNPTTTTLKLIDSKDMPISFTLCKMIYGSRFDGSFSQHTIISIENVSIVYNNTEIDFLDKKHVTFEFVSYLDYPMMCKEFDLANKDKDRIKFVRDALNEDNNLHLYIHQPGMFYIQEFKLKYPNRFFRTNKVDDTNENAKVLVESYDITDDPHFPCSSEIHQECVKREIIRLFNSTYGCTYPLQTEIFGVEVCQNDELESLKNITKKVINSDVCKLPCDLHYLHLHYLPGSKRNDDKVRTFTFYFDTLPVNLITQSKLVYGTWDYIYEIGGWIGLFLGYSVIGIYDDFVRFLRVIMQTIHSLKS